jgi:ABC-type branched-subunit amino acid transport system permease subunit
MVGALFAAVAGALAAALLRPVSAPAHAMAEPATAQAE